MPGDHGAQNGACFLRADEALQLGPAEDLADRAGRRDPALLQQQDAIGQAQHLHGIMADIDDGQAELVAQPLDEGQDLRLARGIQRRQRLIQQQEPRIAQQRPADGDPLLLAAGEIGRPPAEEMGDA